MFINERSAHMRRRLLMDVDELTRKPYPNVALHAGGDLTKLCLVLSPPGWKEMHLTIENLQRFPLEPPTVSMDSQVSHPNVYQGYVCASILNDPRYYTPAYTLKGIAIQLLSFFCSDNLDQSDHGRPKSLEDYRRKTAALHESHTCPECGYGTQDEPSRPRTVPASAFASPTRRADTRGRHGPADVFQGLGRSEAAANPCQMDRLPNEVLLAVIEELDDFEHLANLARAWPRISRLMTEFDVVRQRELQCFFSKASYKNTTLGVGVSTRRGFASEFDLLSKEAFGMGIRKSVQNISFDQWLALPISRRHWARIGNEAGKTLDVLKEHLKLASPSRAQVLYAFMTDIVVQLNLVAEESCTGPTERWNRSRGAHKSTLRHASEKAIESYFHLFHLLVCLATEDRAIIDHANELIAQFTAGRRSKTECPNLGHLLVALLISDVEITDALRKGIITEAITRNVVWLLDPKGAKHPELSYLEPEPVSAYRLGTTFQGSRTSYRILMFSELFRRTARPSKQIPLGAIRDELFRRHGGPPPGAAERLAAEVRRLHTIHDFPAFLREMGIQAMPSPRDFTAVLRRTLVDSVSKGYSRWALDQVRAFFLRQAVEPTVGISRDVAEYAGRPKPPLLDGLSFFPVQETGGRGEGGGRGGPSGRGARGGRGRGGFGTT